MVCGLRKPQLYPAEPREIVHDCLARHEYIRSKLELEIEEDDSVSYLQELYMKVVRPAG